MEEIIIDGVNVAGCVRLQDDKISCDLGGECKGWENCYYKQLKRLEQENERLKEEINKLHRKLYCYAMDKECKDGTVECKQKNCAIKLYPKYTQTLQEIKAIASETIDIYYPDYYDEGFEEDIVTEFAKQVLDLITKAEEE